jgi:hypothetical protein
MIDKGIDVGLLYAGAAPDLGAYESVLVTAVDKKFTGSPDFSDASLQINDPDHFTFRYFDLTGREMVFRNVQQGRGVIIRKSSISGSEKLFLKINGTGSNNQRN